MVGGCLYILGYSLDRLYVNMGTIPYLELLATAGHDTTARRWLCGGKKQGGPAQSCTDNRQGIASRFGEDCAGSSGGGALGSQGEGHAQVRLDTDVQRKTAGCPAAAAPAVPARMAKVLNGPGGQFWKSRSTRRRPRWRSSRLQRMRSKMRWGKQGVRFCHWLPGM